MQQQVEMQPQIDKTEQRVCIKSYIGLGFVSKFGIRNKAAFA
jgi:hypothetical protein